MDDTKETPTHVSDKRERISLYRHAFLKVFGFACIGLVFYAVMTSSRSEEMSAAPERKEKMALATPNPMKNNPIPPIDAAVPEKTETATFALG